MRIIGLSLVLTALAFSLVHADVVLYKGEPISGGLIVLGGWGSGSAAESGDRILLGSRSIKIVSQGLHEGGRLSFTPPIEITSKDADDGDYIQFVLSLTTTPRTTSAAMNAGPGFGVNYMPGAVSNAYSFEYDLPPKTKANCVRFVLMDGGDRNVEITTDVPDRADDGWFTFGIPFKRLGLGSSDTFNVAEIRIFTDMPDSIYVGEIKTVKDTSSISKPDVYINGSMESEVIAALNDTVTFRASANGGVSPLKYSWNFGDGDLIGEDASGEFVSHRYRKGGDFNVTVTASDIWGMKKPVAVTVKVTVND